MSQNKKYAGNPTDKNKSSNPNSATPYKRKYGLEKFLEEVDPFFFEDGELERRTKEHEIVSQLLEGTSVGANAFRKDFITGTVVSKNSEGYYVNIRQKYDAFVPLAQGEGLEVGQSAEFYVLTGANQEGVSTISFSAAKGWRQLEAAQGTGTIFTTKVFAEAMKKRTQKSAGLRVEFQEGDLKGIRGFIPNPEISRSRRGENLIGQTIAVTVFTAEPQAGGEFGNLVLSNKGAQEVSDMEALSTMSVNSITEGRIITFLKAAPSDFKDSALVKLPNGLVGMVHRSEALSERDELSKIYKVGDTVTVAVRSIDPEKKRVGLSIKLAAQIGYADTIAPGQIVEAQILRRVNYGYFASIGEGALEGLLHESDLATVNGRPERFESGSKVKVEIITFLPGGQRLALGRKFANTSGTGGVVDHS